MTAAANAGTSARDSAAATGHNQRFGKKTDESILQNDERAKGLGLGSNTITAFVEFKPF